MVYKVVDCEFEKKCRHYDELKYCRACAYNLKAKASYFLPMDEQVD